MINHKLNKSINELFVNPFSKQHVVRINGFCYIYYSFREELHGNNPFTKLPIIIPSERKLTICPENSKDNSTIEDPQKMFSQANIDVSEVDLNIDQNSIDYQQEYLISDKDNIPLMGIQFLKARIGRSATTGEIVNPNPIYIPRIKLCKELKTHVDDTTKPFIREVFGENPDPDSDHDIITAFQLITLQELPKEL